MRKLNKKTGVKIISMFLIWLIALLPVTLAAQESSTEVIKVKPREEVCYVDEIDDQARVNSIIASSDDIDEIIERLRIANAYKPFKGFILESIISHLSYTKQERDRINNVIGQNAEKGETLFEKYSNVVNGLKVENEKNPFLNQEVYQKVLARFEQEQSQLQVLEQQRQDEIKAVQKEYQEAQIKYGISTDSSADAKRAELGIKYLDANVAQEYQQSAVAYFQTLEGEERTNFRHSFERQVIEARTFVEREIASQIINAIDAATQRSSAEKAADHNFNANLAMTVENYKGTSIEEQVNNLFKEQLIFNPPKAFLENKIVVVIDGKEQTFTYDELKARHQQELSKLNSITNTKSKEYITQQEIVNIIKSQLDTYETAQKTGLVFKTQEQLDLYNKLKSDIDKIKLEYYADKKIATNSLTAFYKNQVLPKETNRNGNIQYYTFEEIKELYEEAKEELESAERIKTQTNGNELEALRKRVEGFEKTINDYKTAQSLELVFGNKEDLEKYNQEKQSATLLKEELKTNSQINPRDLLERNIAKEFIKAQQQDQERKAAAKTTVAYFDDESRTLSEQEHSTREIYENTGYRPVAFIRDLTSLVWDKTTKFFGFTYDTVAKIIDEPSLLFHPIKNWENQVQIWKLHFNPTSSVRLEIKRNFNIGNEIISIAEDRQKIQNIGFSQALQSILNDKPNAVFTLSNGDKIKASELQIYINENSVMSSLVKYKDEKDVNVVLYQLGRAIQKEIPYAGESSGLYESLAEELFLSVDKDSSLWQKSLDRRNNMIGLGGNWFTDIFVLSDATRYSFDVVTPFVKSIGNLFTGNFKDAWKNFKAAGTGVLDLAEDILDLRFMIGVTAASKVLQWLGEIPFVQRTFGRFWGTTGGRVLETFERRVGILGDKTGELATQYLPVNVKTRLASLAKTAAEREFTAELGGVAGTLLTPKGLINFYAIEIGVEETAGYAMSEMLRAVGLGNFAWIADLISENINPGGVDLHSYERARKRLNSANTDLKSAVEQYNAVKSRLDNKKPEYLTSQDYEDVTNAWRRVANAKDIYFETLQEFVQERRTLLSEKRKEATTEEERREIDDQLKDLQEGINQIRAQQLAHNLQWNNAIKAAKVNQILIAFKENQQQFNVKDPKAFIDLLEIISQVQGLTTDYVDAILIDYVKDPELRKRLSSLLLNVDRLHDDIIKDSQELKELLDKGVINKVDIPEAVRPVDLGNIVSMAINLKRMLAEKVKVSIEGYDLSKPLAIRDPRLAARLDLLYDAILRSDNMFAAEAQSKLLESQGININAQALLDANGKISIKEKERVAEEDISYKVLNVKAWLSDKIENINQLTDQQLALVYDATIKVQNIEQARQEAAKLAEKGINIKPEDLLKVQPALMGGLTEDQLRQKLKQQEVVPVVEEKIKDAETLESLLNNYKERVYYNRETPTVEHEELEQKVLEAARQAGISYDSIPVEFEGRAYQYYYSKRARSPESLSVDTAFNQVIDQVKSGKKPVVITIDGRPGTGKSWFAKQLKGKLYEAGLKPELIARDKAANKADLESQVRKALSKGVVIVEGVYTAELSPRDASSVIRIRMETNPETAANNIITRPKRTQDAREMMSHSEFDNVLYSNSIDKIPVDIVVWNERELPKEETIESPRETAEKPVEARVITTRSLEDILKEGTVDVDELRAALKTEDPDYIEKSGNAARAFISKKLGIVIKISKLQHEMGETISLTARQQLETEFNLLQEFGSYSDLKNKMPRLVDPNLKQTKDGRLLIIETMIVGEDFQDLIDQNELTEKEFTSVIKQMRELQNLLSSKGVFFRDWQSLNIKVEKKGNDVVIVRLVDFGLGTKDRSQLNRDIEGLDLHISIAFKQFILSRITNLLEQKNYREIKRLYALGFRGFGSRGEIIQNKLIQQALEDNLRNTIEQLIDQGEVEIAREILQTKILKDATGKEYTIENYLVLMGSNSLNEMIEQEQVPSAKELPRLEDSLFNEAVEKSLSQTKGRRSKQDEENVRRVITTTIKDLYNSLASNPDIKNNPERLAALNTIFQKTIEWIIAQDEADLALPFVAHDAQHSETTMNDMKKIIDAMPDEIKNKFREKYGENYAELIYLLGLLHDVGYAALNPGESKGLHAPKGASIVGRNIKQELMKAFNLDEQGFKDFVEAIARHGSDKKGKDYLAASLEKNPLLLMMRLADNLDITFNRLRSWQKDKLFMRSVFKLWSDAKIREYETEVDELKEKLAREEEDSEIEKINNKINNLNEQINSRINEIISNSIATVQGVRDLLQKYIDIKTSEKYSKADRTERVKIIKDVFTAEQIKALENYAYERTGKGIESLIIEEMQANLQNLNTIISALPKMNHESFPHFIGAFAARYVKYSVDQNGNLIVNVEINPEAETLGEELGLPVGEYQVKRTLDAVSSLFFQDTIDESLSTTQRGLIIETTTTTKDGGTQIIRYTREGGLTQVFEKPQEVIPVVEEKIEEQIPKPIEKPQASFGIAPMPMLSILPTLAWLGDLSWHGIKWIGQKIGIIKSKVKEEKQNVKDNIDRRRIIKNVKTEALDIPTEYQNDWESLVGQIIGLTKELEDKFKMGGQIIEWTDGSYRILTTPEGGETIFLKPATKEEFITFNKWKQRNYLPEISIEESNQWLKEVKSLLNQYEIKIVDSFGKELIITEENYKFLGAKLKRLYQLLQLLPESVIISSNLKVIKLGGGEGLGEAKASAYNKENKEVQLLDFALNGPKRNFDGLFIHEIGHVVENDLTPEQKTELTNAFTFAVRNLFAFDYLDGKNQRTRHVSTSIEELMAESFMHYVLQGQQLRDHIVNLRKTKPKAAEAYQKIYDFFKNKKFNGEEFGIVKPEEVIPVVEEKIEELKFKSIVTSGNLNVNDGIIKENIIIGRGASADWETNNKFVSQIHAQLRVKDGQILITDLNSENGVYINGQRIPKNKPVVVNLNDKISIGTLENGVSFKIEQETSKAELEKDKSYNDVKDLIDAGDFETAQSELDNAAIEERLSDDQIIDLQSYIDEKKKSPVKSLIGESLKNNAGKFKSKLSTGDVNARAEAGDNSFKQQNEDSVLVDESTGLMLVADGMGGHGSGEVASRIIAKAIQEGIAEGLSLEESIKRAQKILAQKSKEGEGTQDMGATLAVVKVEGNILFAKTVGDARIYVYDKNGMLKAISKDQSLVQEDIEQKGREIERTYKEKNVITNSISANKEETSEPPQGIFRVIDSNSVTPEGRIITDQKPLDSIELEEGDVVIVSSDGVNDYLPYDNKLGKTPMNYISDAVKQGKTPEDITNRIISSIPKGRKGDNIGISVYQHKVNKAQKSPAKQLITNQAIHEFKRNTAQT